jgi:hypothetical protein
MSVNQGRRIALTVPDSLDLILDRLCVVQNKKKTRLIIELLSELEPVLSQVADALEAIKQEKDPAQFLNALTNGSLAKIGELSQIISEVNTAQSKKCADTLELPL